LFESGIRNGLSNGFNSTGGPDEDIQFDQVETGLAVLLKRKENRSGEIFVSYDSVRAARGHVRGNGLGGQKGEHGGRVADRISV
jgi:hypothetical protein